MARRALYPLAALAIAAAVAVPIVLLARGEGEKEITREVEEIRAVDPPNAMHDQVTRMLAAQDETVVALRRVLAAANVGDVPRMAAAFGGFFDAREAATGQSRALGITC